MAKERWCYLLLWVLPAISLTLVSSCQPATVGWVANPSRWELFNQGLPSYALTLTVAADPFQPGVLYAGTYQPPGLWRSDDDGETWLRDDQGLENQPVFTLHWDPVQIHHPPDVSVSLRRRVSERNRPLDGTAHTRVSRPSLGEQSIGCLAAWTSTDRR